LPHEWITAAPAIDTAQPRHYRSANEPNCIQYPIRSGAVAAGDRASNPVSGTLPGPACGVHLPVNDCTPAGSKNGQGFVRGLVLHGSREQEMVDVGIA
jgi:hypothetical protein